MFSVIFSRNAFSLIIFIAALANLVIGGLVLADSPRRKVNRIYSVLCVMLAVWAVAFIGLNINAHHPFFSLFWARLYAGSLLLVPPLFYHLILGSIGNPFKDQSPAIPDFFERVKQLAYVFAVGWFFLSYRSIFPARLFPGQIFYFPSVGQQFWISVGVYALLSALGIFLLSRHAQLARDATQKNRLFYMLAGAGCIIFGLGLSVILTQATQVPGGWIIAAGHLSTTLCMVLIAYALTTNQLYHFSEFFRKTAAFLTMTSILLAVFGGTHLLSQKLLVPYLPRSDFFALGMASVVMAIVFHPLRFRVQNMVDRVFFSRRFDQLQRLRGLSRRVLSSADRDELMNILFSNLREIGFGSVCLLLKDPQKPLFHIRKSLGLPPAADGFFLKSDSLLIQYLREEKKELIRDEVTRRILADWERQALSDEMEILNSEICFPLFSTRRRALFGLIALGSSDLGYSSYKGRNIFWLKSVIDNAGIMLDNFYHQEFANALIPYVGRTWADEMRRNKEGFRERLAGHRTWVSVMMVDIRHFTTMSAHMDPREVVSLLKEFRSRVAPVVYRYQGTIDKFIGDAVMVVFGLPILPALHNPDKNAALCATALMNEIESMNQRRASVGYKEPISIGIGISSGEVIAGNVDSGDRLEYTVIGDAVNMVARLEDLAGDNQILLSPATYNKVKDYCEVNAWPPRLLTGFDDPVPVYELMRAVENPISDISGIAPPRDAGRIAANQ